MTAREAAAAVEAERLVAIIRLDDAGLAVAAARAAVAGGVRVLELSLASAASAAALGDVAAELGERALVGAGTVLSVADAEQALGAGARFLISPGLAPDVAAWARERDVLHIPGAFTPTEVIAAHSSGATLVKLFPAGRLGPAYVSDLLGPLPSLRLVPTGGVDAGNAPAFLAAGAAAVAVGSALVNPGSASDPPMLTSAAQRFRALVAP
jgi:2-dehydro-3-deoxyphosphogluconate aldolase / (4S)-4-hydroxy-2-oxoglutarate aldolase